jgi:NhaP-type Na+/H+ or K+/H+ antiporter
MINYNEQPKLFSIIYGEGVFNDIVSIILFKTVSQFEPGFKFTYSEPFKIFKTSGLLALYSIGIGLLAGMMSSLMFKWFRFFTHSAITETSVIYILAMISYFVAEIFELSGLISLVTCGITMGHYTWYNLSPQGKSISSVSVSIFGAISESLVFTYIGLSLFTYANST